ncbi:phosphotriesterase-related protein [Halobacillus kuroshimensis]|uniref:Phosphotriesterase-related protein n=1 Tax=Halobacillus kuroshimensis TaxID=302481 RepID=A0ABS3E0J6_9BACI|nr:MULTISPECIES: phosphotriesterase-related protein [Halobacillus]MBN8237120.1 phosphotriesterase-related protein [Halobacillus kuroshimensis]
MQYVETVTGPIKADKLGKTLIHEHFFFGYPGFQGDLTLGGYDFEEKKQQGLKVAELIQTQGIETVVDPTPNECGRHVELLRAVSEASGLNIICATGYYYEGEGATPYFKFRQQLGTAEEEIYQLFKAEITEGIEGTGIKPGIIKLASSKGEITAYERMFFRAAVRVQKETGVVLLTHTQEGTMGPEQAAFLMEEGADPKKVVIGHMCGTTDITEHLQVLKHGVYLAMDRWGLQGIVGAPADEERTIVLKALLGSGYEDQLFLSHDTVNVWWGREPVMPEPLKELLKNWKPDYLFQHVLPGLLEEGAVTSGQLEQIFSKNPARLFGQAYEPQPEQTQSQEERI